MIRTTLSVNIHTTTRFLKVLTTRGCKYLEMLLRDKRLLMLYLTE
jgi:hypothetical protein